MSKERLYTQEEVLKEKNISFKDGQAHSQSAPETRERLAKLEVNQNNFMVELQEIKQMIKDLDSKVSCALEKKAGIWVEKVLIWSAVTIGGLIATYLTWFFTIGSQHFLK